MVFGILAAIGVTFIVGYATCAYQTANADQDDQQRDQIDKLKRRLKELEKRSSSCYWYFFTFFFYIRVSHHFGDNPLCHRLFSIKKAFYHASA